MEWWEILLIIIIVFAFLLLLAIAKVIIFTIGGPSIHRLFMKVVGLFLIVIIYLAMVQLIFKIEVLKKPTK